MKCKCQGCDNKAKYNVKIAGVTEPMCKEHKEGFENKIKSVPVLLRKKLFGEFKVEEIK